jgi:structural maintenance of chromosomes protein 5
VAEKKQAYGKLEESGHKLNQTFNTVKKLLHAKKQEAEAIAPLVDEDGNDLPLKAQLESLEVSDFNEADIALEEAKKLLNQYDANPEVIRQYEKLKDEIELIERKLADCTSTREKGLSVLTEQRKDWETRLEKYIDKINALFTLYMSEMGCTGEVCLTKGPASENGEEVTSNFKHWGLEIRVSFREGCKAEVLSAERHSGGERSVSTILYLMALQDLMVAPFRCVDEINQGLDERNERLVFKRIVANSCRAPTSSLTDHSGQYFLITPKLLPNLTDMEEEAMTLLFVFNGPFNFKSPTEWDDFVKMQETPAVAIEAANDDENSDNIPRRKSKKSRLTDD